MKKVRDLSPDQRKKLSPLFLAQEKYCRQLLTYHEVQDIFFLKIRYRLYSLSLLPGPGSWKVEYQDKDSVGAEEGLDDPDEGDGR